MVNRIKLVYLINSLGVGGAEVGMIRLLDGLDTTSRFDVTVVTLNASPGDLANEIPDDVDHLDLGIDKKWVVYKLGPLLPVLRETDVLVCSLYHSTVVGTVLGTILGVDTILNWMHITRFESELRRRSYKELIQFSDALLADSKAVEEFLVGSLGVTTSKVYLVPIAGIDLDEFSPVTHEDTNSIVVGTIGRLIDQKNPHTVVDTAEHFDGSGITFRVAGDGPLREEITEYIASKSVTNVEIDGFVDDIPSFLHKCDIYFQPSRYEGLCITVIEAMACGLPVVASAVGGIQNSVVDGETGFTVTGGDVDKYEKWIEKLAANSELRASFGSRGRERVRNHYSQEVLVDAFTERIYREHK